MSKLTNKKSLDIVLPGQHQKVESAPAISPANAEYGKHKKMKTIWLASTSATAVVGTGVMVNSIGLHNDYETVTDDAAEIRKNTRLLTSFIQFVLERPFFRVNKHKCMQKNKIRLKRSLVFRQFL